jgi:hypothetical protein
MKNKEKKKITKGYIYIATNSFNKNHNFLKEAVYSAKSLKKVDPSAKICLFTDDKKFSNDIFNEIKIVNMSLRCKQRYLIDSPYDKTIYIDTDTYINHSIDDMFYLLDKYELLCIHDYARKRIFKIPEYMKIPYGFSELNGGIIAFKKCKNFNKLIKLWNHYYNKYKKILSWDQPSFRIAVWESNINLYILPTEYNRRGLHTKEKCINLKKNGDKRFGEDHLKTRVFHFHDLEKMNNKEKENKAQYL